MEYALSNFFIANNVEVKEGPKTASFWFLETILNNMAEDDTHAVR